MVKSMDVAVGEVLEALERNRVAEETVVVFTSDNGGLTTEGSNNAPLRDKHCDATPPPPHLT